MPSAVTFSLDPQSLAAMARMQAAIGAYKTISSRAPAKFVGAMASKLMLGEDLDGGGRNEGLYGRMAALAPARGQATREAEARKFRMGRPNSTSLSIARARVNEMLGRGESGAFKEVSNKFGSSLKLGTMYTKGRRAGSINFRGRRDRLKNASDAVGVRRAAAQAAGGVLLNRQAAITAIAIRRREAARMADAVQFLPSRYRKTFTRLKGIVYRSGQAVGLPGGSADSSRYHLHETALVQNAKGKVMGAMEVAISGGDASIIIRGLRGIHTSAQQAAIRDSMNMVADYAVRRVIETGKEGTAAFRAALALRR